MTGVFADTSFYLALLSPRDQWHTAALGVSREMHRPVVTSEYVLCELGALMSQGTLRAVGRRGLREERSMETDPQSRSPLRTYRAVL